ncbi:MAG: peptidylprolyl isomerase, partial [Dehalococcoidia bacterium]
QSNSIDKEFIAISEPSSAKTSNSSIKQNETNVILERISNAIKGGYSYEGDLFMNMIVTYGEYSQELPLNMKGDVSPNGNDFSGIVDMTGDGTALINVRIVSDKIYLNTNGSTVWEEIPEGQKIISPPGLTTTVIENILAPEYVGTTVKKDQDAGYITGAVSPSYLGDFVDILKDSNGNVGVDIYIDPITSYIISLTLTGSVKAGPQVQSPTGEDVYIEVDLSLDASNFGKQVSVRIPQLPPNSSEIQFSQPPLMTIDQTKDYSAKIFMFGGGVIDIDLFEKKAPITVNNFVHLAEKEFYNGVTFHRVIPGFMAQTGDPTGTGSGGPGYEFQNEFHVDARHDSEGVVSMANAGIQNGKATNGSQFFITYEAASRLDGLNEDDSKKDCTVAGTSCHSVFGKVTQGMDVLRELAVPAQGMTPDVIEKVLIYSE